MTQTNLQGREVVDFVRRLERSLVAMHRAVAISQFFPPTHPLVGDALRSGYASYRDMESEERLGASGLRVVEGGLRLGSELVGRANPAVGHLSRILSEHGVVRFRPAASLGPVGYADWVKLLATDPDVLTPRGGLRVAWNRSGHAESLELQCLSSPSPRSEGRGGSAWDADWSPRAGEPPGPGALADPVLFTRLKVLQSKGPRERQLLEWLLTLGRLEDAASYDQLLMRIGTVVKQYREQHWYRPAYQVVIFLAREAQSMEALGQAERSERLLGAVRTIVDDEFLKWILQAVTTTSNAREAEVGEQILSMLGQHAVISIINALAVEEDRVGRRRLVATLIAVGEEVVPFAVRMLEDRRWYVVRNMVAVLGGVASPRALGPLRKLCLDSDPRVQREVVRALGKIPNRDALSAIVPFLDHPDSATRRVAVISLAAQHDGEALEILWTKYQQTAMGSQDWELRVTIVEAIGKMGLVEATDRIAGVIEKRALRYRARWERLWVACVLALGELGGVRAESKLRALESDPNPDIRRAAEGAMAALGRSGEMEDI